MDDYKGIFAQECEELPSREYLVRVVSRTSLKEYWRGTVVASSKKGVQAQWRIMYPHIRSQYDHSYALAISPI